MKAIFLTFWIVSKVVLFVLCVIFLHQRWLFVHKGPRALLIMCIHNFITEIIQYFFHFQVVNLVTFELVQLLFQDLLLSFNRDGHQNNK